MMPSQDQLIPLESLVDLQTTKAAGPKDPARPYVGLEHIATESSTLLGSHPSSYSDGVNCVFEVNDILFGKLRPNLRKCVLAPFDGYCSTDILVLRAKEGTNCRYAARVLQSEQLFRAAVATAAGTKMPRTSWSDLKRVKAVTARTVEEQRRIATILDLVDAAIERTQPLIAKLHQVRSGLLADLVTDGIGMARTAPLVSRAAIRFSSVNKLTEHGEMPVRLCNYTDVYKNTYILSYMPFMRATASAAEVARFGLRVGDVIITKDSETPDDIGVPAVVDSTAPDIVCGYHLALIRPDLKSLDPLFLAMQLKHTRLARYFGRQASGSTRYGLSTRSIEQAPILKLPVYEQKRRSDVLREHDRAAAQVRLEAGKLRAIKAGLMSDLLSGQVRVSACLKTAEVR